MDNLNTSKTSSQILLEAADLLEQEGRWTKGSFFKQNDSNPEKGCSMCAHGAIMYCSDAEVRRKANNNAAGDSATNSRDISIAFTAAFSGAHGTVAFYKNKAAAENLTLEQYLSKHYGEACVAHYRTFKAGLHYLYNDKPSTTL